MALAIKTGTDDFAELLLESTVFVDKSLFIKEFIEDSGKVVLITRPRRWGKSLNMDMLARFLAIEVDNQGVPLPEAEQFNRKLFCGGAVELSSSTGRKKQLNPLRISKHKETMAEYQGQFPVISIGLKGTKGNSYEAIKAFVKQEIKELFGLYAYLKKQPWLTEEEQQQLAHCLSGEMSDPELKNSLEFLSQLLKKHFGKKVYVLIDEYDTPINHAYGKFGKQDSDQFEKVLELFRGIFGAVLKGNKSLKMGLVTGILRIAKAGLFSDLNNLNEYTLLDEPFSSCYGFTEEDVVQLMQQVPTVTSLEEIRRWYNGYTFGGKKTSMYNPWSIMNCLARKGHLSYYWIDSGGTTLVNEALLADDIQEDLQALVAGRAITIPIMKEISFEDINSSTGLFSLLLFAGYLNPDEGDEIDEMYRLSIPNHEVTYIYRMRLLKWLARKLNADDADLRTVMHLLAMGKIEEFEEKLRNLLAASASFFQTGAKNGEVFYNGFMFCLFTTLSSRYAIESELESGKGRPDVLLIPRVGKGEQAIVIEYKISSDAEGLEDSAEKGLAQIIEKGYTAKAMAQPHVKSVLQVAMAFCGKEVALAYERNRP